MGRNFLSGFVLAVLLLGVVCASTDVKVTTYADHKVNLQFLNPEGIGSFGTVTLDTGESGEINYTFDNTAEFFDLSVYLIKDKKTVLYERFEGIENEGNEVCLIFVPGLVELQNPCEVEEVVETEVVTESENDSESVGVLGVGFDNSTIGSLKDTASQIANHSNVSFGFGKLLSILGFATADEESQSNFSWNFIYYILGLIVLLVLVFFVVRFMRNKKQRGSSEIVEKKPVVQSQPVQFKPQEEKPQHSIEDVEKRIADAQKELQELKKIEEIRRARKKLAEDQERLRRLQEMERQGESYNSGEGNSQ